MSKQTKERTEALEWWRGLGGSNPFKKALNQSELVKKYCEFERKTSSLTGREIQEIYEQENK